MLVNPTRRQQYDISSSVPASFTFAFSFFAADEFFAALTLADGSTEILVNGTNYTLTAPGAGGMLTRIGTWTVGATLLTLYRETPLTQETHFENGNNSDAVSHEAAHDRAVAMIQENQDNATRTLLGPVTDPEDLNYTLPGVLARANRYLSFDNDGNVVMSDGVAATGTVNALQLGGHLPGHGDEEIPISDDVVNPHLFAGRAAVADDADNSALLGGKSPANTANNIPVRSALNHIVGPIDISAYYHSGTGTDDTLFHLLDPFIPNNGDSMKVTGAFSIGAENDARIVSRAVRNSATVIYIYYISSLYCTQGSYSFTDGGASVIHGTLSW